MNAKKVKKLRKYIKKNNESLIPEFKEFINNLTFMERGKIAFRVLRKKL